MAGHAMGDRVGGAVPRSVDDLAAPWLVKRTTTGVWTTAECPVTVGGRRWVVGLTPTRRGLTALILWSGDEVVSHARGTEAQMCAAAHRLIGDLHAGGVPGGRAVS